MKLKFLIIISLLFLSLSVPTSLAELCDNNKCTILNPEWESGEKIPIYFAQHHHGALGEMMGDWIPNNELTATIKIEGANLSKTVKDPNIIALYNFEDSFNDAGPNGFDLNVQGNAQIVDDNGNKVLRTSNLDDNATINIPDMLVMGGTTPSKLTIEAKIFPRNYKSWSINNFPVVSLSQSWDSYFSLIDGKWNNPRVPSFSANKYSIISPQIWNDSVASNQWHQLRITFDENENVSFYVDDVLLGSQKAPPNYGRNSDWGLALGNFDGDIDDVVISSTVRENSDYPLETFFEGIDNESLKYTWSEIFEDNVLDENDVVLISEGAEVVYDDISDDKFRAVVLKGKLSFDNTIDTKLTVGTIHVYKTGEFEIKNDNPFIDTEIIFLGEVDLDEDPGQFNLGLMTDGGKVNIEGAQAQIPWTKLLQKTVNGSNVIFVENSTGWRVGNKLYVEDTTRGTAFAYNMDHDPKHEIATILNISGNQIILDKSLQYEHDGYVVNPARNIILKSDGDNVMIKDDFDQNKNLAFDDIKRRGQILLAGHVKAIVKNARIEGMGRTLVAEREDTKYDEAGNILSIGKNQRARYALHVHHAHEKFLFEGNSIVTSPRFGIVNHDSYGDIIGNTIIGAGGSGIFAEDGVETGIVEKNFVLGLGGGSGVDDTGRFNRLNGEDMGAGGFGYWFRGPLLQVKNNLAAGYFNIAGYAYYRHPSFVKGIVPYIDGIPGEIKGKYIQIGIPVQKYGAFENNIAEIISPNGLRLSYSNSDLIKNFKLMHYGYNSHGVNTEHVSGNLTIENPNFVGGGKGLGYRINNGANLAVNILGGRIVNFETGYSNPPKGGTIENTYLSNYQNLVVEYREGLNDDLKLNNVDFASNQINILFKIPIAEGAEVTATNYDLSGRDYRLYSNFDNNTPVTAIPLYGVFNGLAEPLNFEVDNSGISILSLKNGDVLNTNSFAVNYQVNEDNEDYSGVIMQLDNYLQVRSDDGSYTFENIPHGYHTLRVYPVDLFGASLGSDTVINFGIKTSGDLPELPRLNAGDLILYDGEENSVPILGSKCWGEETIGYGGGKALLGKPGRWNAPSYNLYCGNEGRRNLSPFEKIEFYFRNNGDHGKDDWTFKITTWNYGSNVVNIKDYIDGGVVDDEWRLVSIPLNNLKTAGWKLDAAERLTFSLDPNGRQFAVDNIVMRMKQPA